jgi:hypothetical protein
VAKIFVSYTSSDRERAEWIDKELKRLNHEAHVHNFEVEGGADIYAWMESRLDEADRVLCVFSDEYQRAPFSILELHAALWHMAKQNKPGFVLPVVVKPCRMPILIDHIHRCELFGIPRMRRERGSRSSSRRRSSRRRHRFSASPSRSPT